MMKVLFLWHAAADPNNRSVLEEAISHPGLDILVLATPVLEDRLSEWSLRHPITKHSHRSGSRLRIIPAATFMPKSPGYHFHPSLPLHIIRFRPDLIHIHEEAASLAAVESSVWRAILAPRARLIIHPYQNIRVDYRWPWPPLERFVLECADAAVAGNPGAARVLAGRGFRKPVFLLRTLGAYARDFSMQRRGPVRRTMKSGVPVIGFSGRIFSGKGLHILSRPRPE